MCLATSSNLLLVLQDAPKRTRDLLVSQKTTERHFFPHPPSPFPGNFCNCNSGGICTASQFQVQLPMSYTAWNNAYSEIGSEVTLRPFATFCVKDYKGHSLIQTSFTELPNTHCVFKLLSPVNQLFALINYTVRKKSLKKTPRNYADNMEEKAYIRTS